MHRSALLIAISIAACSEKAAPATLPEPLAAAATPVTQVHGRCAMCGMDVALHPEWVGTLELMDGSVRQACSVRCTLGTVLHAAKFLGVEASQIRTVRVPDYLHPGARLDATAALYVVASELRGPMGAELVPAASEADAQIVVGRHGGRILRYPQVTPELLLALQQP